MSISVSVLKALAASDPVVARRSVPSHAVLTRLVPITCSTMIGAKSHTPGLRRRMRSSLRSTVQRPASAPGSLVVIFMSTSRMRGADGSAGMADACAFTRACTADDVRRRSVEVRVRWNSVRAVSGIASRPTAHQASRLKPNSASISSGCVL